MKRYYLPLSLLLLAACASGPSNDFQAGDAEAAIRKADAAFEAGARAGDANVLANTYAADAVLLPPNMPMIRGRDAIHTFWSGLVGGVTSLDVSLNTTDVQQSGDLAVETGTYRLQMTPKNATAAVNDEGKFLIAWRKIDGQWKIVRDMFSSDAAPAH